MTETHIDTRDALITTDLGPEQQAELTASMYNPVPLPITAEQYTNAKTSMNLVKLTSTSTDYTVTPAVRSAHVQSNIDNSKNYVMRDTDWVVVGPNLEAVYTNTQFIALYGPAAGNTMSFSVGTTPSDSMAAQLFAYIGGAAGTLDIDWGDGSVHSTPSVSAGVNPAVTHKYAVLGSYSVWVVFKVSGTTVNSQPGTFLAQPPTLSYSNMGTGTDAPAGIVAPTIRTGHHSHDGGRPDDAQAPVLVLTTHSST